MVYILWSWVPVLPKAWDEQVFARWLPTQVSVWAICFSVFDSKCCISWHQAFWRHDSSCLQTWGWAVQFPVTHWGLLGQDTKTENYVYHYNMYLQFFLSWNLLKRCNVFRYLELIAALSNVGLPIHGFKALTEYDLLSFTKAKLRIWFQWKHKWNNSTQRHSVVVRERWNECVLSH